MSMKKRLGLASVAAVLSLSLAVGAGAVASDRSVEGDASRIVQWAQSSEWVDEGLAIYAGHGPAAVSACSSTWRTAGSSA